MGHMADGGLGKLLACPRIRERGFSTRSILTGVYCATDPILAYSAGAEINQLQWSSTQPDWVAIAFGQKLQILRV